MKRFAVAILAVLALAGCGVGADESYDGENLVGTNEQALESGTTTPTVPPAAVPQTPVNTTPSPLRDPGTVALPQDPIPVFEGRPAPNAPPFIDPMVAPAPRPGVR